MAQDPMITSSAPGIESPEQKQQRLNNEYFDMLKAADIEYVQQLINFSKKYEEALDEEKETEAREAAMEQAKQIMIDYPTLFDDIDGDELENHKQAIKVVEAAIHSTEAAIEKVDNEIQSLITEYGGSNASSVEDVEKYQKDKAVQCLSIKDADGKVKSYEQAKDNTAVKWLGMTSEVYEKNKDIIGEIIDRKMQELRDDIGPDADPLMKQAAYTKFAREIAKELKAVGITMGEGKDTVREITNFANTHHHQSVDEFHKSMTEFVAKNAALQQAKTNLVETKSTLEAERDTLESTHTFRTPAAPRPPGGPR